MAMANVSETSPETCDHEQSSLGVENSPSITQRGLSLYQEASQSDAEYTFLAEEITVVDGENTSPLVLENNSYVVCNGEDLTQYVQTIANDNTVIYLIESPPEIDEKSYRCNAEECSERDVDSQKHNSMHSNFNMFCTLCSEEFSTSDNLWVHIHVHAKEIARMQSNNSKNALSTVANCNAQSSGCAIVLSFLEDLARCISEDISASEFQSISKENIKSRPKFETSIDLNSVDANRLSREQMKTLSSSKKSSDCRSVSNEASDVSVTINLNKTTESNLEQMHTGSREQIEMISQSTSSKIVSTRSGETYRLNFVINLNEMQGDTCNGKDQAKPNENSRDSLNHSKENYRRNMGVSVNKARQSTRAKEYENNDPSYMAYNETISQSSTCTSNSSDFQSSSTESEKSCYDKDRPISVNNVQESSENLVGSNRTSDQDSDQKEVCSSIEKVHSTKINTRPMLKAKPDFCSVLGESDKGSDNITHEIKIECNTCNKDFSTREGLKLHMQSHVTEDKSLPLQCSTCGEGFSELNDLQQHFKIHQKEKNGDLEENLRQKFLINPGNFECEILTSKRGKISTMYHCVTCIKSFLKFEYLEIHMCSHTGEKPYKCKFCNKRYTSSSALKQHLNLHTGERPFACSECSESFQTTSLLKSHELKHEKSLFSCDICKEDSRDVSDLNKLVCKHKEHKLLRCNICSRSYTSVDYLKRHKQKVHGPRKTLLCKQCDRTFVTRKGYENHLQAHKERSRFVCEVCNTGFAQRKMLKEHLLIHVRSPYSCKICLKPFREAKTLSSHVKTHSNIKPFQCQFCEKSFLQRYYLTNHLRIHKNVKQYQCEFCQQRFRENTTIKRHRKTCAKNANRANKKSVLLESDTTVPVDSTRIKPTVENCEDVSDKCPSDEVTGLGLHQLFQDNTYSETKIPSKVESTSTLNVTDKCPGEIERAVATIVERQPIFTCTKQKILVRPKKNDAREDQANLEKIQGSVIAESCERPGKKHCPSDTVHVPVINPSVHPRSPDSIVVHLNEEPMSSTQKTFVCEVCSKTFTEKSYLTGHCRVMHSNAKHHKCPFCPQTFIHWRSSQRHRSKCVFGQSLSEDEKKVCLMELHQRTDMEKRQKLIRDGARQFPCKLCYKIFAEKTQLNNHMHIHNNVKPFSCEFCHRAFRHSTSRRRHHKTCDVGKSQMS